jgi:hypothetical protein
MNSEDLKKYVIEKLNEGVNADEIWSSVIESGNSEDEVHVVFEDEDVKELILEKEGLPPVPPEATEDEKKESNDPQEKNYEVDLNDVDTSVIENVPIPPNASEDIEYLPDIKKYVVKSLEMGFSKKVVKDIAVQAGWSEGDMNEIFADDEVSSLLFKKTVD